MTSIEVLKASSARLSAIVHATEDPEKVRKALSTASSRERFSSNSEEWKVKGHHGNEILVVRMLLPRSQAEPFFESLWKMLPRVDQELFLNSIGSYIDHNGDLHLRLDKQDCFRGNLRLQNVDPIKVQVSFPTRGQSISQMTNQIREKLESLID